VLYALNRLSHPGQKRLAYTERTCAQRPEHMASDVATLIQALGAADHAGVSQQVTTPRSRLDTLLQREDVALT
jgi:hypothetical protein